MGDKLRGLFARAHEKGGPALAGKLALKTRLNSASASTAPDDPTTVALVTKTLEELLREPGPSGATAPAAAAHPAGKVGKIGRYFEFARQKGGIHLLVKLAGRTNITSTAAQTLPDDPARVNLVRSALVELLPGVEIPTL